MFPEQKRIMESLEQELIEKIKQEAWNLYPSQILDKLIGDNSV
jgi:hypothetical protein